MEKRNIADMTLEELEGFIAHLGKEKYRAKQIMKWLYQQGAASFEEMTTLSKAFREEIAGLAYVGQPVIEEVQTSQDGTKKILFKLEDGLFIESVLIPGKNHWTACLSTQAGCAMGCCFCLTAKQGFKRNLKPSEITGQMIMMQFRIPEGPSLKTSSSWGWGSPCRIMKTSLLPSAS